MANFFISYSGENLTTINTLVSLMRAIFSHDCLWYDSNMKKVGDWWTPVSREIEKCEVFLFLYSEHSAVSGSCLRELSYAIDLDKPILPVVLCKIRDYPTLIPDEHTTIKTYLRQLVRVVFNQGESDPDSIGGFISSIYAQQEQIKANHERERRKRCIETRILEYDDYRNMRAMIISRATEGLDIQVRVSMTLEPEMEALQRAIQDKGVHVRLAICDPHDAETMEMLLRREYKEQPSETDLEDRIPQDNDLTKEGIIEGYRSMISRLEGYARRSKTGGTFEYSAVPFGFSNVAFIADPKAETGAALTALTSFRREPFWDVPSGLSTRKENEVIFDFYVEQFEELWKFGRANRAQ